MFPRQLPVAKSARLKYGAPEPSFQVYPVPEKISETKCGRWPRLLQ